MTSHYNVAEVANELSIVVTVSIYVVHIYAASPLFILQNANKMTGKIINHFVKLMLRLKRIHSTLLWS